ncbi:MAG: GntG family PLP-dependent aldolase [Saprospiraceae bacterium]
MINLISDTITRPDVGMLQAMFNAEVGDDVFHQDNTMNAFQERIAGMFGMEDALFCPSGTMTNQIALRLHLQPTEEIICDISSHIYQSETGGYGFNSGAAISLIHAENGIITPDDILKHIKAGHDWQPVSKLVVVENSNNKGGGSIYTLAELEKISSFCKLHGLKLHLDGARIFNVLVETQDDPRDIGKLFDTISICMSKGLGAPIGSVLLGNKQDIKLARRYRKVMGGGMRQVGYLAAACDYALDHNIPKLKIDNARAKILGKRLVGKNYVLDIKPVQTNIVIFTLKNFIKDTDFIKNLEKLGLLAAPFGDNTIRFVYHLDITHEQFEESLMVIDRMEQFYM